MHLGFSCSQCSHPFWAYSQASGLAGGFAELSAVSDLSGRGMKGPSEGEIARGWPMSTGSVS